MPVKGLRDSKSRLRGIMPDSDRMELALTMLGDTLRAILASRVASRTLVITPDTSVTNVANAIGAETVIDDSDLNGAVARMSDLVHSENPHAMMVVIPCDVPLLRPATLQEIVTRARQLGPPLVMATRSKDNGTNMLLMNPAGIIRPRFGPDSFEAHRQEAIRSGARFEQYVDTDLEFDIDREEDVMLLGSSKTDIESQRLVREILRSHHAQGTGHHH
ncbi:MAG: 2-phospho-L-lactate guanylyltransferase [Candidatus Thorarchaeota archaeon]